MPIGEGQAPCRGGHPPPGHLQGRSIVARALVWVVARGQVACRGDRQPIGVASCGRGRLLAQPHGQDASAGDHLQARCRLLGEGRLRAAAPTRPLGVLPEGNDIYSLARASVPAVGGPATTCNVATCVGALVATARTRAERG
ncbi:hypothetical protein GW17_00015438 [Ensete ventricosum]|nr:hypothetical protein GW17_00015438 [Ensete ventricosum]RZR89170.1 hypothetical protein BHM03_00016843 [Ensete ventricosum]